MQRCRKFVIEVEKDIPFQFSEETEGTLIIRKVNNYSTCYKNPPVPEGYKHICGEWNDGYVIERELDGSQFVWIPVGSLESNGTLNNDSFTEKFGRRNYSSSFNFYPQEEELSEEYYKEPLTSELELQLESVKKYGGFYISRYNISKNKKTGKPQSVKGELPWIENDYKNSLDIVATIEKRRDIKSHLPFGAEYDSILEWFIESKAKTIEEIDCYKWGNYLGDEIVETGSKEEWCVNNIYDFAGNVREWTQEQTIYHDHIIRGCSCMTTGCVADREEIQYIKEETGDIGFRAALYIK